jgi:hypothetical protein
MGFWQYITMPFSSTGRQHINIQSCQHSSATAMVLVYTSWSKLQISFSAGYGRLCLLFVIHHQITDFFQTNLLFLRTAAENVKSLVMLLQITFQNAHGVAIFQTIMQQMKSEFMSVYNTEPSGGIQVQLYSFLISVLSGNKWFALRPARFTQEKNLQYLLNRRFARLRIRFRHLYWYILILIYLLTAIGLAPGGCSTVHIYTQTIHRTIQNKQYIKQHNNFGRVRAVSCLG